MLPLQVQNFIIPDLYLLMDPSSVVVKICHLYD